MSPAFSQRSTVFKIDMAKSIADLTNSVATYIEGLAEKIERGAKLRVGFLEGSTGYYDGEAVSIPMIAAIQNFGAPRAGIPPRPFFNDCIENNKDSWGPAVARQLVANDYDGERTMNIVGAGIAAQLKQSITDTNSPPLSPVTLMLRKMRSEGGPDFVVNRSVVEEARQRVEAGESYAGVSTKPLIYTGQLQQAVDYEVDSE